MPSRLSREERVTIEVLADKRHNHCQVARTSRDRIQGLGVKDGSAVQLLVAEAAGAHQVFAIPVAKPPIHCRHMVGTTACHAGGTT